MRVALIVSGAATIVALGAVLGPACSASSSLQSKGDAGAPDSAAIADAGTLPEAAADALAAARAKIQHVILINQENRSFDHYFGTFPGADGIPMDGGVPTVCSIVPDGGGCRAPYHDPPPLHSRSVSQMAG
jgi:hypothetical protein